MNLSYITGIFSSLFGVFYLLQTLLMKNATIGSPLAPKMFPMGLGVLMIIFGVGLTIVEGKKTGFTMNIKNMSISETGKLIGYTCFGIIIYALSFNRLGYIISTILFLEIVLSLFNGLKEWKMNTAIAVIFSIFIYIVFSKMLGIILPPMPFLDI